MIAVEREPQALTPAFIRYVEGLPDDASQLQPSDVEAVVRAWLRAPELDRPFLRPVLDRIREHHAREA